jgi:hypothetical protein
MWVSLRVENLIQAVIDRLGAIKDAIQENKHAIENIREPQQKTPTDDKGRIIAALMPPDDEYARGSNTYKHKSYWTQIWLNWITVCAFLAAAIYAAIAAYQLGEIRKQTTVSQSALVEARNVLDTEQSHFDRAMENALVQTWAQVKAAKAAERAAKIASDTFTKGSRPWVGPEGMFALTQAPQITLNRSQNNVLIAKSVSGKFSEKNFGRDPALFVKAKLDIVETTTVDKVEDLQIQIAKAQDQSCQYSDKTAIPGPIPGTTIFPDGTAEFEQLLTGLFRNIPAAKFDEKRETGIDGQLMLAGCISYRDQFKAIHHTRVCFISNDPVSKLVAGSQLRLCHGQQNAD